MEDSDKVKNKRKELSEVDRVNAEFKHLKKRIKRLEQLVLVQKVDNGNITEEVIKLKKG